MREKISEIVSSEVFLKIVGKSIHEYHFSGTIGLIRRLCQKGWFSEDDIKLIISDIKNSTFRISDKLIGERAAAKKAKDWGKADSIRDSLKAQGILLEDSSTGTTWKRS